MLREVEPPGYSSAPLYAEYASQQPYLGMYQRLGLACIIYNSDASRYINPMACLLVTSLEECTAISQHRPLAPRSELPTATVNVLVCLCPPYLSLRKSGSRVNESSTAGVCRWRAMLICRPMVQNIFIDCLVVINDYAVVVTTSPTLLEYR